MAKAKNSNIAIVTPEGSKIGLLLLQSPIVCPPADGLGERPIRGVNSRLHPRLPQVDSIPASSPASSAGFLFQASHKNPSMIIPAAIVSHISRMSWLVIRRRPWLFTSAERTGGARSAEIARHAAKLGGASRPTPKTGEALGGIPGAPAMAGVRGRPPPAPRPRSVTVRKPDRSRFSMALTMRRLAADVNLYCTAASPLYCLVADISPAYF